MINWNFVDVIQFFIYQEYLGKSKKEGRELFIILGCHINQC